MKDLSIWAIGVWQGLRSLRDSASYWVRAGLCTTDHSISKLSSSFRSESFYVCNWGSCGRPETTSPQLSCCTPRRYIFLWRWKSSSQLISIRAGGWGGDEEAQMTLDSRRFIPVNSITLDWSRHDKPLSVNFKKISVFSFREEKK